MSSPCKEITETTELTNQVMEKMAMKRESCHEGGGVGENTALHLRKYSEDTHRKYNNALFFCPICCSFDSLMSNYHSTRVETCALSPVLIVLTPIHSRLCANTQRYHICLVNLRTPVTCEFVVEDISTLSIILLQDRAY